MSLNNHLKLKKPVKKCSHGIIKGYCTIKTCPHYGIRFASLKKPVKKSVKAWLYQCPCSEDTKWGFIFKTKGDAEDGACEDAIIIPVLITPIDK